MGTECCSIRQFMISMYSSYRDGNDIIRQASYNDDRIYFFLFYSSIQDSSDKKKERKVSI